MRPNPLTDLLISGAPLFGMFMAALWFAYIISVTSNLRKLRKEAERQTRILEEIAANTAKPKEGIKSQPPTVNYMREESKIPMGTVLIGIAILLALSFFVTMAQK